MQTVEMTVVITGEAPKNEEVVTPSTPVKEKEEEKAPAVETPSINEVIENKIDEAIKSAISDSLSQINKNSTNVKTVKVTSSYNKGISLPNSVMKKLVENKNVALELEYYYDGTFYRVIIPAGTALDNDIPWYGPLYLAQYYAVEIRKSDN